MSAILLRPALLRDMGAITAIYAHAVLNGTASYELDPPSAAEMRTRFEALAAGGFPYLVAERGDAILGYAYAGPFRPRPAYRFALEDSVYVDPAAQGAGLGRVLLERLLTDASALGFRQMIAVIGDGHAESASVRLHERLGFTHAGRLEGSGFKHGRWLDTVFMQKALNGGSATEPDPDSQPERRFRSA